VLNSSSSILEEIKAAFTEIESYFRCNKIIKLEIFEQIKKNKYVPLLLILNSMNSKAIGSNKIQTTQRINKPSQNDVSLENNLAPKKTVTNAKHKAKMPTLL
jgi:hypothetical protein